jgi:hypothetical protein
VQPCEVEHAGHLDQIRRDPLELVGTGRLGIDTVVMRDSGISIDKLEVAFWACGC